MGMLGDSWDNKRWLGEGNHVVKIREHRMFEFNTGSPRASAHKWVVWVV